MMKKEMEAKKVIDIIVAMDRFIGEYSTQIKADTKEIDIDTLCDISVDFEELISAMKEIREHTAKREEEEY